MERINVWVETRLKQQLEAEARERGVRPCEIVRQALEEHLRLQKSPENCLELAQRLGIVGFEKDLPADLSTTSDYMEGFGE